MGLPKYFDNLHIGISAITGEPRIACINPKKPNQSDKYKTIDPEEWKNCVIGWFSMFQKDRLLVEITQDWGYCIGGKTDSKEKLIHVLREVADSLERELK